MRVSPLGALFAIVVVGVTIEVVEQQSKPAAYGLVLLLLLGIITFNSATFTAQMGAVVAAVNGKSTPRRGGSGRTVHTAN